MTYGRDFPCVKEANHGKRRSTDTEKTRKGSMVKGWYIFGLSGYLKPPLRVSLSGGKF